MSAKEYCVDNGLVFGNQYNFGYLLMSTGKRHDVFPMCVALAYLCKKGRNRHQGLRGGGRPTLRPVKTAEESVPSVRFSETWRMSTAYAPT